MAIVKRCSFEVLDELYENVPKENGHKYYHSESHDFGVAVLNGEAVFFNIPDILTEEEEYELLGLISLPFHQSPSFDSTDVEQFYEEAVASRERKQLYIGMFKILTSLILLGVVGIIVFIVLNSK